MKMFRFCTAGLLRPAGPGQARGAEVPRRRVAHFGARREARVAAPRLGVPRPTLALALLSTVVEVREDRPDVPERPLQL